MTATDAQEPAIHRDARRRLADHGYRIGTIYRVEAAGDSGEPAEIVLYTTPDGQAKTARIERDREHRRVLITTRDGW